VTSRGPARLVVGLTGPNAAGKGEAARYLVSRGLLYHSLSDILREEVALRGLPPTREHLIEMGNLLRRERGAAVLAERTLPRLNGRDVIDSIRNPAEVTALRSEPSFVLLAVDAPVELRFARARSRSRPGDGDTLREFVASEERERGSDPASQQIHLTFEMADLTVSNAGTIEQLEREISAALSGRLEI
jgi:dephospho-CoA kinase